MSKQSDAKVAQGYVPKAIPQTCCNCRNFRSDIVEKQYKAWDGLRVWNEEKNLRCGIGGFAVKKGGTCNEFAGKETA